jgi:fructosamine-3-kinase
MPYTNNEIGYFRKTNIPRTLDGGIIGKVTIFIDVDGVKKVRKVYEDFKMLESEALSLKEIGSYGLNVPEIYKLSENPNEMIMEYIDCEEYPDPRLLKLGIESLHSIKSDKFGNIRDGYTLRLKVTNTQNDNWVDWWTTNRWDILANALEEQDKKLMLIIRELIPNIINVGCKTRNIVPSLIHGDYNDRNMLVQKNTGKIYFIDSQCYFGDPYYEYIQYKAQSTNVQNITNPLDLLYLAFVFGLLHQTLSFKNSYIWRARICMNKILDKLSPIWPSPHVEINKNTFQYVVLMCGSDIFCNVSEQIITTPNQILNQTPNQILNQTPNQTLNQTLNQTFQHCIKKHQCALENILVVL